MSKNIWYVINDVKCFLVLFCTLEDSSSFKSSNTLETLLQSRYKLAHWIKDCQKRKTRKLYNTEMQRQELFFHWNQCLNGTTPLLPNVETSHTVLCLMGLPSTGIFNMYPLMDHSIIKVTLMDVSDINCNYVFIYQVTLARRQRKVFQCSSQTANCLPYTVEASYCSFQCWTSSRNRISIFAFFGLVRLGIEPLQTPYLFNHWLLLIYPQWPYNLIVFPIY